MMDPAPGAPGSTVAAPYAGRRIALATMHEKERAFGPPFENRLGAELVVPASLNTDTLGTFSGEIERKGTMGEVAVKKARMGMVAAGLRIGLASEGTYGPHPQIPFFSAGMELIVLVDDERGIIVSESLIDETPCFGHVTAGPGDDIATFLTRNGFPKQAVIVGPNRPATKTVVAKGISSASHLSKHIIAAAEMSGDGLALIRTDMRAHMNPTRMATLGRLAAKLTDRLNCACPACAVPGFGLVKTDIGLPCERCGWPSVMVWHHVFSCVACDYREVRPRPDGLMRADPGHCPTCNP